MKSKAFQLGRAFALGMAFHGECKVAQDAAEWITVHPNGKGMTKSGAKAKGRPVLIEGSTGEVLGGMGGKFNGRHISAVSKRGKNEQHSAQQAINYYKNKDKYEKAREAKRNQTSGKTYESIFRKEDFRVKKETQNAVLVHFTDFSEEPWFDGDDKRWDRDVWLPKSQIQLNDGMVTSIAGWLAKKHGIETNESRARTDERKNRYEEVIKRAKEAGIKGVRKGMRYASILEKARKQGIDFTIN